MSERERLARIMVDHIDFIKKQGIAGTYIHEVPKDMNYQEDWWAFAVADVILFDGLKVINAED